MSVSSPFPSPLLRCTPLELYDARDLARSGPSLGVVHRIKSLYRHTGMFWSSVSPMVLERRIVSDASNSDIVVDGWRISA